MYPPCSSPQNPAVSTGITRYGSAPGSFLTKAVDSFICSDREFYASPTLVSHHYSGDSSSLTSESSCKVNSSSDPRPPPKSSAVGNGLHRSYGFNEISSSLVRQKSSPAGFQSHLSTENGFSITSGSKRHNSHNRAIELSFTGQDSLSHISEVSDDVVEGINGHQSSSHSYSVATSYGMGSWDNANSIVFSDPPSKLAKNIDGDIFNCLNSLETQFSLPQTSLEMATMEKLLNIPEDSVPCKIRAKRGCATHPRSIAERERRTRISGRLKKLQELVPNMDKQTSYADMLDLAVQHIRGLQNEVQKLHNELENCTCGCKPTT